ncbi:MAG: SPFH domain-containing protein [Thermoflexales bacterium]|nr:SPFH domain-containing protein [Thermoflexales bacterium]MDW8351459.1 SPFH domain-containing protein [Anaerolineae bacterium]
MKPSKRHPPLFHRLERALGRLFGRYWVDEDEVAVVYENERFHSLHRGPAFFDIDPLTQTIRCFVNVAPDAIRVPFRGIQTRDGLPVDLELELIFEFVPEQAHPELVHLVVRWTQEERRDILCWRARVALQRVLARLTIDAVCRGALIQEIEQHTLTHLKELVNGLGLKPTGLYLSSLTPPPEVHACYAEVSRRRIHAHDLAQYTPNELSRVMQAYIIEALSRMSPYRQYAEFPSNPIDVAPSPVIDATPRDVPSSAPSLADRADNDDRPSPPKKRPRSRLRP